ncbi:hypothetical protein ADUPG1_012298, partial [Aduncisulcus paluster]
MKNSKIVSIGVKKLKERELPAPYLESLDSDTWERFLAEYDHYPLRIIAIIAKVTDFTISKNRIRARKRITAIFRGSSKQSISDQLKGTRMRPELTMKALSEYIGSFDSKRSLDPRALDGKSFVHFFICGLFPSRLRVRVRTAIGPDGEDVEEAIRQSLSLGSELVRCVTEGLEVQRQIEAEKSRRSST